MGRARLPGPRFARCPLRCGILAHGFARARCAGCGYDFLVAFSCRSRGACPSCNARRMVETAAHLVDHVLPPLPVRQWVLSVPKRLRPFLHHNPAIAGAVLRIFLRAIRTTLRHASPGAGPGAQIGAISFLHRFGSSLNAHFHFHVCVIDGVFSEDPEGSVQFHEATHLTASDWDELQQTVRHRVLRYFHCHGLLERHVTDDMLNWQASGGFSIDASVHIPARDRAGGLERLLRYCARPPFALERLEATGDGASGGEHIIYRLAHPAPGGTTALSLTPLEFLERLALLIHPPRIHRHGSYLDLPTRPPPLSPARAVPSSSISR
ncbi:MAG: transposase [Gemmatimonadetes bacterium]|nr:transposase [Gemmatimonadota bacterium]